MATLSNANRPDLRAYIGATGSGKGVSIRAHLEADKAARRLIWDPLDEYSKFARKATQLRQVVKAVADAGTGPFAVRYVPPDGQKLPPAFDVFCQVAYRAGNLQMLVEELADVTSPSWAPPSWRACSTRGRHVGLRIVAATQRPALCDKTFLGNTTYIRCFTLRYPEDRKAMAGALDMPVAEISALRTVETDSGTSITYIERDFRSGLVATKTEKLRR